MFERSDIKVAEYYARGKRDRSSAILAYIDCSIDCNILIVMTSVVLRHIKKELSVKIV